MDFTQRKLYSRLSSRKVHCLTENGRFAFLSPPWKGEGWVGAMCDIYLMLIGKRVVDFLLVLIELYSLGVTAEALRAKIDFK